MQGIVVGADNMDMEMGLDPLQPVKHQYFNIINMAVTQPQSSTG